MGSRDANGLKPILISRRRHRRKLAASGAKLPVVGPNCTMARLISLPLRIRSMPRTTAKNAVHHANATEDSSSRRAWKFLTSARVTNAYLENARETARYEPE